MRAVIAIATESVTVTAIIILVSSDLAVASDIRSFAAVAAAARTSVCSSVRYYVAVADR